MCDVVIWPVVLVVVTIGSDPPTPPSLKCCQSSKMDEVFSNESCLESWKRWFWCVCYGVFLASWYLYQVQWIMTFSATWYFCQVQWILTFLCGPIQRWLFKKFMGILCIFTIAVILVLVAVLSFFLFCFLGWFCFCLLFFLSTFSSSLPTQISWCHLYNHFYALSMSDLWINFRLNVLAKLHFGLGFFSCVYLVLTNTYSCKLLWCWLK